MSYKNNPVKKMSAGLSDLMGMEAWEGRGRKEGGGGGIRQGRKLDVSHDERRGRKGRMEGGSEGGRGRKDVPPAAPVAPAAATAAAGPHR
jgi:hypothetical protein